MPHANVTRWGSRAMVLAIFWLPGGCGDGGTAPPHPTPVALVEVGPASATLLVGRTLQLTAVVRDSGGGELIGRAVTWVSTDAAVATVSTAGLVTARGTGRANIIATSDGAADSTVIASKAMVALANGIDAALSDLGAGDAEYFTVHVPPGSGSLSVSVYPRAGRAVAGDPDITLHAGTALDSLLCSAHLPGPDACVVAQPPETVGVVVSAGSSLSGYAVRARHDGPFVMAGITAGSEHTCGLASNGSAYCWGGMLGGTALGDGTRRGYPAPVPAATDARFVRLALGGPTCALTADGATFCWGWSARLDGQGAWELSPVHVATDRTFVDIAVGGAHACGIAPDRRAWCWGTNFSGAVGDGTRDTVRAAPVPVVGDLSFASIDAGDSRTCAVTTSGAAYCWGGYTSTVPVEVGGGRVFASVVVGSAHACGLTPTGQAFCWGSNESGQLGDGTGGTPGAASTVPVAVAGGLTFAMLSVSRSWDHSCGVTTAGAAYCWGGNYQQKLGDGTNAAFQSAPSPVAGGLTFATISAGRLHTCGLTTTGAAYCWGWGIYGNLGDRTTDSHPTPTMVLAR